MKRRHTRLDDGRYLIFYTFEDEPRTDGKREPPPDESAASSSPTTPKGRADV